MQTCVHSQGGPLRFSPSLLDRFRRSCRRLLPLLVALVALGPAQAQATVVDDLDRPVTTAVPAQRVVAMIPTHTETVCALGACDRLVGVDRFSNHPASVASLPSLGSAFDADVEAIVALEPDLVLTDEYSGLAEALDGLGIPVYAATAQTIDDIWEVTEEVAALLGLETEGALLVGRTRGRLDALTASVADRDPVRVFVEIDATPYSVGPGSYLGTLLARAGLRNVVPTGLGDFPRLDPEQVIDSDPEAIVLLDAPYGETLASVAARPGWANVSAVRTGRVIEASQAEVDLLTRAGPRVAEALRLVIDWFEPDVR